MRCGVHNVLEQDCTSNALFHGNHWSGGLWQHANVPDPATRAASFKKEVCLCDIQCMGLVLLLKEI